MTLTTSRNKTYDVDWIDGPTLTDGMVTLQMSESRRLPEIAEEFDGLEWLKRESETQGNKLFEGFSRLAMIRQTGQKILLSLDKEATSQ